VHADKSAPRKLSEMQGLRKRISVVDEGQEEEKYLAER
jgi:hypothetical protein